MKLENIYDGISIQQNIYTAKYPYIKKERTSTYEVVSNRIHVCGVTRDRRWDM